METVFIADDEKNIRDGLKCILDWTDLGFQVAGEAGNGEDALSYILQNHPSLVLLDIRMPKLTGIDIIRIAREQGYTGKFIILSGYSDFTYAQAAIRYGVNFYLTKPIDEDELLQCILSIRKNLEEAKSRSKHIAIYQEKAKDVILHELITGAYHNNAEQNPLSAIDLEKMELNSDIYQVVMYEKFGILPEDSSYSFAELLNITNRGNHSFEHFVENQKDVILLKGPFALKKFDEFLQHYEKNPPQTGSPLDSLFLAYGRPVNKPADIYLSYEDAHTLVQRRFFCIQGQHTLGYTELPNIAPYEHSMDNQTLQEYCDTLVNGLQAANRKLIATTLFTLEEYLYNTDSSIASVKLFLTDLLLQIKEMVNHLYSSSHIAFPNNTAIIDYIDNCHYLYEIIQFISEQVKTVMEYTNSSSRDSILDDILYYIDHHYHTNIKLETIAPLFGYNSAYLGKLFTKTTGETFNSYVDHRRIEHSKQLLLNENMKVYEIAEQVGYKNVDYFHKKFKKYVGISPIEYRKQLQLRTS